MATRYAQIPPMLTVSDVAARLQVCTKTVRRRIDRNELRVHRIGRHLRISEDDVATFIAVNRK